MRILLPPWPDAFPKDDFQKDAPMDAALPHLRPAEPPPLRPGKPALFSDATRRALARRWHIENPEFLMDVLVQSQVIADDSPANRDRVMPWLHEAVAIGLFSKADLCQYCIACLNAGGSIATVPTVRAFMEQFSEDTPDIMQRMMDAAPISYWTYLPQKVHRA
jgi:hypothetical protein